jgi:hypothetical protein
LNPDDLFEYYRDTFLPAYSDVVGFTAKKHIQFLIEMENTLTHVAQYYTGCPIIHNFYPKNIIFPLRSQTENKDEHI